MNEVVLPLAPDRLERMARFQKPFCVSIYLPMYKTGKEQNQGLGQAQLNSALDKAVDQLSTQGMPSQEIEAYVAPLRALVTDFTFWRNPSEGVAIFLYEQNGLFIYKSPVGFSPFVYVSNHFYIVPLLALIEFDSSFYLLQLSQDYVKLSKGDLFGTVDLPIAEFAPQQLEETVGYDFKQKMLQFRTGQALHGAGSYHGHGEGKDDDRKEVLSFFREIDKSIKTILQSGNVPLIIACVDELLPLYKKANTYSQLIPQHLSGDPQFRDKKQLQHEALKLIHQRNDITKNQYRDQYKNKMHTTKTSHQVSEIIPAATAGKIDTLFLKKGAEVFGTYNKKTSCVILDADKTKSNRCLINMAAAETYLQGGRVLGMEAEAMPEHHRPLNALFRY
jgi:hypothetical protein